jgi:anti-sigma factor RsiW
VLAQHKLARHTVPARLAWAWRLVLARPVWACHHVAACPALVRHHAAARRELAPQFPHAMAGGGEDVAQRRQKMVFRWLQENKATRRRTMATQAVPPC